MNFEETVRARRSIRKFTSEAIPEEIVQKSLDLALLAPTSSNLQCWEFHRVTSAAKKAALVEACLSQPAAKTAAELIVAVARTKTWRQNAKSLLEELQKLPEPVPESLKIYYTKLVPMVYTVGPCSILGYLKGVFIFLVGIFRPVPREPLNLAELRTWAVKTTALACENLMLAFSSFGYDTCPMEGMDSRRVRKILNLPRDAVVVMVIGAGKRAQGGLYGPQIRLPRERFIKEH